ncbi:MAG: hypothetical protein ABIJ97_00935 [Bacteroidota bacterium]
MINKTVKIICVIMLTIFASCKKDIVDINSDFVGDWIGPDGNNYYSLTIEENSNARYTEWAENIITKEKKGILRIDNDKISMSRMYLFRVIEQPFLMDSLITFMLHDHEQPVTWQMKLKLPKSFGGEEIVFYK